MTMCGRHALPQTDPKAARMQECYMCRIETSLAPYMPREPSYRYFTHRGWRYCWATERMGDGKYAAFMYQPTGKGSRTGNPTEWKLAKELHFTKRSTAKARALKWYTTAKNRAAA